MNKGWFWLSISSQALKKEIVKFYTCPHLAQFAMEWACILCCRIIWWKTTLESRDQGSPWHGGVCRGQRFALKYCSSALPLWAVFLGCTVVESQEKGLQVHCPWSRGWIQTHLVAKEPGSPALQGFAGAPWWVCGRRLLVPTSSALLYPNTCLNRDPIQTLGSFTDLGQDFQVAKHHRLCVVLLVVAACTLAVIKKKDLRGL